MGTASEALTCQTADHCFNLWKGLAVTGLSVKGRSTFASWALMALKMGFMPPCELSWSHDLYEAEDCSISWALA